ncbi:protein of unknown function [Algoriphagus locisalis]|uniref:TolB-like 6-blade propeller-like n=1 Tax=Algoriphagus locisalis TaxID=305507 RepID=A0A1I6YA93_9BACT|nr:DUF4221 family protein [Algoriphagus locisalis]SFT47084.1 protein of unknown function [Algoriphagus locisalis]
MKSAFLNLILATLFSLIYACSPSKESAEKSLMDFQVEELTIPIGPEVDPYTMALQYVDGDLFWHNKNRSTISKINLASRKVSEYIRYESEGPQGVGNIVGFYVFDQNKIAFPGRGRLVSIYDMETNEVVKIKLSDFSPDYTDTKSLTRFTSIFHFWNNKLILPQIIYFRNSYEMQEGLKKFSPFLKLNLSDFTVETTSYRLSKSNFGNIYNDPSILLGYNLNETYILPFYSHRLDVFNINSNKTKSYQLQSNLIPEFTNIFFLNEARVNQSIEQNIREVLSEPQNLGMLVDPNKNLLYRMTWPGTGVPEGISSIKFDATPSHFILSVYDENFELKYEFELPEYEYIPHQYFVSEKGLHLFGNHPDHPDSKEDQLVIHTFDFSD